MTVASTRKLAVEEIRKDFPILATTARGRPLVYLDNAATTLKPKSVVEAVQRHLLLGASNVHRGVHYLSEKATADFEASREKVRSFINAREKAEIIFTAGTTAGINLVAHSYGSLLKAGDEIIISAMEHHSNIVPWQMLCERQGLTLRVAPVNDRGELDLTALEQLINQKTRLVAIVAVSNALGTINPIKHIIDLAHSHDVPVLLDAAQAVAHISLDVQALDVDFLAFSSHKLFGPTGLGVLYGRRELLDRMPPFLGGGDMIRSVTFAKTTYADLPAKFEAGTPHIAGVIGLGAAIDYVNHVGLAAIAAAEDELLHYGTRCLSEIPGLRMIGTAEHKTSILGFVLDDIHPHDIGTLLDQEGIAIRAGHHCTQPLMDRFGVPATARASLAFYNTKSEIDTLVQAILKVQRLFA
jgi:cysteine desulfurase/selenocysteine lyase